MLLQLFTVYHLPFTIFFPMPYAFSNPQSEIRNILAYALCFYNTKSFAYIPNHLFDYPISLDPTCQFS